MYATRLGLKVPWQSCADGHIVSSWVSRTSELSLRKVRGGDSDIDLVIKRCTSWSIEDMCYSIKESHQVCAALSGYSDLQGFTPIPLSVSFEKRSIAYEFVRGVNIGDLFLQAYVERHPSDSLFASVYTSGRILALLHIHRRIRYTEGRSARLGQVRAVGDFAPYNAMVTHDGLVAILDLAHTPQVVSPFFEIARYLFMMEVDTRRRAGGNWVKTRLFKDAAAQFLAGYQRQQGRPLLAEEKRRIAAAYRMVVIKRCKRRFSQKRYGDVLSVGRRLVYAPCLAF